MRDFITACNLEKTDHEKIKMFITSSKFSPKARSLAEEHDIKLIDGDILLK
jgi:restriction endonuclease Mrr